MFDSDTDKVIVYIYNADGRYSPGVYIAKDTLQIASFIVKTKDAPQIIITDTTDNFILNTIYGYVDRCHDQEFLKNKLLPELILMQENKKTPVKINILAWGVSEEFNRNSYMLTFIKQHFGVDL